VSQTAPSDGNALRTRPEEAALTPGSAKSLLLTILGELVWPTNRPARTGALLHVMKGLGLEEQTARQAIARGAAAGWLRAERRGREVSWHLTESAKRIFEEGSRRVTSMVRTFDDWDGTWLIVLVSIPNSHRSARKRLYTGLTWAGFGNPAPGVWLSPHPERRQEVASLIGQLDLIAHTMSFRGRVSDIGLDEKRIVASGWDLDAISQHYAQILAALADAHPAPGDDMLFTHIRMISEWQRFPFSDPHLPEQLLPDWIGRQAAQRIRDLRAQWLIPVRDRWAEVNADGEEP
jgi:phenylacetic acid degradation operon negative regulatory protein